jgi:hypothetical protein
LNLQVSDRSEGPLLLSEAMAPTFIWVGGEWARLA